MTGSVKIVLKDMAIPATIVGGEISAVGGQQTMKVSATARRPLIDMVLKRLVAANIVYDMNADGTTITFDFSSFEDPKVVES